MLACLCSSPQHLPNATASSGHYPSGLRSSIIWISQQLPDNLNPVTALWSPSGSCIKPCYSVASTHSHSSHPQITTDPAPTTPPSLLLPKTPRSSSQCHPEHLLQPPPPLPAGGGGHRDLTSKAAQHSSDFSRYSHHPHGWGSCQLTLDTCIQSMGICFLPSDEWR